MSTNLADNSFFVDFKDSSAAYDSNNRLITKSQKTFFSQSQCITDDGRLLVLYHASPNDFDSFDAKFIGSSGGSIFGKGFYFCDDNFGLDIYGKHIKEYYLNLKNPFRWEYCEENADYTYNLDMFIEVLELNNFVVSDELRDQLELALLENGGGLDTVIEQTCGVDFAQKYFIKAGYDGIMNLDVGDFVAFYPNQIKLCTNKNPANTSNIAA